MKPREIKTQIKKLSITPSAEMYKRTLSETLDAQQMSSKRLSNRYNPNIWKIIVSSNAGCLIVALLVVSSWIICFILLSKVTYLGDKLEIAQEYINTTSVDETETISLYLTEHQDVMIRHASLSPATVRQVQMQVDRDDILYYEIFDEQLEYLSPGVIVRGPSSQYRIKSSEASIISNGHTLTLSEAREMADFNIVALPRLHPGYKLDQIRKIEDRDSLHLLYTDGINSVSLFEQSSNGESGLSHQDFREYAVYRNKGQVGGTILAWRDETLSYVLIGNIEISQLMNLAQSINSTK